MPDKTDLISALCGKLNSRFIKRACKFYDPSNAQCVLLRKQQMKKFWEKCRCEPFTMMYEATQKILKKFQRMYPALHIDDYEDVDFEGLVSRLKSYPLKNRFTIVAWRGYMYKTVYMEIRNGLPIPAQKKCGACKFLPDFKPLICQQNGSEKKKTDNPCEEYAPKIKYTTSIDVDNSNEMNQTGRLEAKITEAQEERAKSLEDIITLNELIIKMIKALNQRIEEAPRGSAQRKMFQRQYEIFVGLFQSFSEDETYEKAVKRILTAFGVTKKTVQRDISEIENFLKKNVPGL